MATEILNLHKQNLIYSRNSKFRDSTSPRKKKND